MRITSTLTVHCSASFFLPRSNVPTHVLFPHSLLRNMIKGFMLMGKVHLGFMCVSVCVCVCVFMETCIFIQDLHSVIYTF